MFARARELAGKSSVTVELTPTASACTVKQLVAAVVKQLPAIEALLKNMVLSVNLDYTAPDSEQAIKPSDEVFDCAGLRFKTDAPCLLQDCLHSADQRRLSKACSRSSARTR